jgi:hypothetical protein
MDDKDQNEAQPSRRKLLAAGAASAGALAFGGLSLEKAMAAPGGDGTGGAALPGLITNALPPTIPGARQKVIMFAESVPLGNGASAEQAWNFGTYRTTAGFQDVPVDIDPGSTILRIDIYGYRTASGNVAMTVYRAHPASSGGGVSLTTITTSTGTGVLQGSYTTPYTIPAGEKLYLESSAFSASNITFLGAIVTYYDANPQLNLLDAPIRVYDSRPGEPPATGVKARLAGGTRAIDMTYGGAVPVGARAALINLTVTATSAIGFLAAFKGGIAYPGTSSINWDHVNEIVAVTPVTAVSTSGIMNVYCLPGASTDFIVDVLGFYA